MKKHSISILLLTLLMSSIFLQFDLSSSYAADDWPMFRRDLNNSGYSLTTPATSNNVLWKFDTGSTIGASPTIVDGKVYIPSNSGSIYCLDAKDGSQIWVASLTFRSIISSSIAVENNKLYFGSYNGYVYCLNADTRTVEWYYQTGDSIQSSPAVAEGRVYIGSWDGNSTVLTHYQDKKSGITLQVH